MPVGKAYVGRNEMTADRVERKLRDEGARVIRADWHGKHYVYVCRNMSAEEIDAWLDAEDQRLRAIETEDAPDAGQGDEGEINITDEETMIPPILTDNPTSYDPPIWHDPEASIESENWGGDGLHAMFWESSNFAAPNEDSGIDVRLMRVDQAEADGSIRQGDGDVQMYFDRQTLELGDLGSATRVCAGLLTAIASMHAELDATPADGEWVDERGMRLPMITPLGIAKEIATAVFNRTGEQWLRITPVEGRGPDIRLHPRLAAAVRLYFVMMPYAPDFAPRAEAAA